LIAPGLGDLAAAASELLRRRLGESPVWLAAAPGRINLIGEHTDYNDGFVLPMAIDRHVVLAAAPARDPRRGSLSFFSRELDSAVEIPLHEAVQPAEPGWSNYVRGVVAGFQRRGVQLPTLDAVVLSDVPLGGGLSSSAALEVGAATLLAAAAGVDLPPLDQARLCQQAEQRFAGVPCGIMDQLACTMGDPAGALLIDCRTDAVRPVPLPSDRAVVLVCNSQVRHALGDGAYARRRAECTEAARLLDVLSLRAATESQVEAARDRLPPAVFRRARHVTSENARTEQAAAALAAHDYQTVGSLMYESHRSLRDDYEVSCPELDALVEAARAIGVAGGVWGARLTGGGFGGCTVTLVRPEAADALAAELAQRYGAATGRRIMPFVVRPARGAHLIRPADLR
jgi:galactokinase